MESSLQGKVIRQLIAHASSDLLIGEKIRNGELRKKLVTIEPRVVRRGLHIRKSPWMILRWSGSKQRKIKKTV